MSRYNEEIIPGAIQEAAIAIRAVIARTLEILPCSVCRNENPTTAVKPEYGSNTPTKAAIKNNVSEIPGIPCVEFVLTPMNAPNVKEMMGINAHIFGFSL